jgi:hypothetical protein
MALYVIRPPNPPAGADWLAAVPGQYVYDVTGITAVLTTGTLPGHMIDASGNNRNGFYVPITGAGFPAPVAGLVAGNGARRFADLGATNSGMGDVPGPTVDFAGAFTFECLIASFAGALNGDYIFAADTFVGSSVWVSIGTLGDIQLVRNGGIFQDVHQTAAGVLPYDNAGHYVAITFDGITALCYVDGALVPWTLNDPPVVMASGSFDMSIGQRFLTNAPIEAIMDEVAVYPAALGAGQVAAHYGAIGGGIAAYAPAVLADGPGAYYHLDDTVSTGRQVTLAITDGTHEPLQIPTGFAAVLTPGPYAYSWQPKLSAHAQTPDGTLTTVPIPQLVLPAGYTIGTQTLDIQPTDQWSDIAIWWSSDVMDSGVAIEPYKYPPGVTLFFPTEGARK